jgi:hypothetical protein
MEYYVAYTTYRNSGDYSNEPELRNRCTCGRWDTHTCLHYPTLADAEAALKELQSGYENDMAARRVAMSNR